MIASPHLLSSSNDGRFSIMICFHSKIMFIVQMRVFIHVRHFMGGIVVDILIFNHFHIPLFLPFTGCLVSWFTAPVALTCALSPTMCLSLW